SLTRFGAPKGKCPDTSAAGALDEATHQHWDGKYESSFGDYEVLSILGEAHSFSSKDFWELFVNNGASSTGACGTHLHAGEELLFAAVPDKGTEFPIAISAPAHVRRGDSFTVKVDWFKGGAKIGRAHV